MSAEEIIHSWKNEQQPDKTRKPEKAPGKAPTNPAGEQELSDEELELVEGGSGLVCSCDKGSCVVN